MLEVSDHKVPYQASPAMLQALQRACDHQEHVKLLILSTGMREREVEGVVDSIDMIYRRFKLKREGRDELSEYSIRWTFSITNSKGEIFRNEECYNYRRMIFERRREKELEAIRMIDNESELSKRSSGDLSIVDELRGTMGDKEMKFFFVTHKYHRDRPVVLYAKDRLQMSRALSILDSDVRFWDAFPVLLRTHFMWAGWMNALGDVREEAARIRGDLPVLGRYAEYSDKVAREEIYSAQGLSFENYGVLADLAFLETETPPYELAHAWAEQVSAPFLRIYLINAGNYGREHYGHEITDKLKLHLAHGMARKCPERPLIDHLQTYGIKSIRGFIEMNGKPFKARSRDPLIEFLIDNIRPEVEAAVRHGSRVPTYEYLPPEGMTYTQFINLRLDYKMMYQVLFSWLSNSDLPPKLHERLKKFV